MGFCGAPLSSDRVTVQAGSPEANANSFIGPIKRGGLITTHKHSTELSELTLLAQSANSVRHEPNGAGFTKAPVCFPGFPVKMKLKKARLTFTGLHVAANMQLLTFS